MPRALDPEQQRIANMRRRAAMLERHAAARGDDGKSTLATSAGQLGGRRTADRHGSSSAWGTRMALARHHGIPFSPRNAHAAESTAARQRGEADGGSVDVSE